MLGAVGDLSSIFLLSLLAMFNPTLLAAVTVMLLLPNPKKLMLGYLLGAYVTSIIARHADRLLAAATRSSVSTAKHTLSPIEDIVVGLIALLVAYVLGGSRAESLRERRRRRKEEKAGEGGQKESLARTHARARLGPGHVRRRRRAHLPRRLLPDRAGPDRQARLRGRADRLIVLVFCLIQQLLLEVPLLGYAIAPERTESAVAGFRDWLARNGHRAATIGAAAIGGLLLLRGLIELLASGRLGEEAVGLGDHRVAQLADPLDLDADRVADLEQALGEGLVGGADAGRRAGGDHVAGLEREGFGEVGDLLEAAEDHLAGVAVLALLVVDEGADPEPLGVAELVRR